MAHFKCGVLNTTVVEVWLSVPGSEGGGWRWWCRAAVWWVSLCTLEPIPGPCPLWWGALWLPGRHASPHTAPMQHPAWGQMEGSQRQIIPQPCREFRGDNTHAEARERALGCSTGSDIPNGLATLNNAEQESSERSLLSAKVTILFLFFFFFKQIWAKTNISHVFFLTG